MQHAEACHPDGGSRSNTNADPEPRFPLFLRPRPDGGSAPPAEAARLAAKVKRLARAAGLDVAAITDAAPFPGLAEHLEGHVAAGRVAGLDWFTPERAAASADPAGVHPGARSIVAVGLAYLGPDLPKPDDGIPRGRISRYARGADYHRLLRDRMRALHRAIEQEVGRPVDARFLVDTARVVDRALAARAGLGWYGKHACLIVPGLGSWVLLGALTLDLDLAPDAPLARDCGRCAICLDRCPTGAIVGPHTVSAPRCLSFQTIEQRGAIPRELRPALGDWVYGCDVCQEVCPYTAAASRAVDRSLLPATVDHAYPSLPWLLAMDEATFRTTFRHTPVVRAKRAGLARNAAVALGNIGNERHAHLLERALAEHDAPLVRGHAAWALGRVGGRAALRRARDRERDPTVREEIEAALAEA